VGAGDDFGDAVGKLLHPRSIAILGASDNPVKLSGRPVDYLKRFGYSGRVLPVNPHRSRVQGIPAFRSLDEIDGEIDLALVMLPAEQVVPAVRKCAERGIPAAIIGAAGFAETGAAGAELQRQLTEIAAERGIRLLGPNCLGMINVRNRAVATFTSALDENIALREGPVAFVSQSGAFGSFIFSAAQQEGIGISHYLNTGNEADLSVAEILSGLVEDPQVQVLMAYLEGLEDGEQFLRAARRAHELDKPLLVVKVGRSTAGARAAHSHTASLAGEDTVFDGAVRQHGVVRVGGLEPLLDAAQVFAAQRRPRGRRLTTLSLSGGAGVLMADAAANHRIEIGEWEPEWQQRMASVIPPFGSPRNPIDLTATLISEPDLLRRSLQVAVKHPGTDMIAVLLGNADSGADQLIEIIRQAYESTDRPIVVVWTGGSGRPRQRLRELGIPCFTDPARAAAALGALADFSFRPPLPAAARPDDIEDRVVRAIVCKARSEDKRQLDEYDSTRLIAAYGIPCAGSYPVTTVQDAVEAAAELGGRVAVKLLSDRIGHKTDVGGVRLDLRTPEQVREAAADLLEIAADTGQARPAVLVQRMVTGGAELVAGIKRDPVFGPVVLVGFGGVLVDVLADTRIGVPPFDSDTARRLLLSLRASEVFAGLRGQPALDLDGAADAVMRLSWLAADLADEVEELDVNPLVLGPSGATAVDCLAVLSAGAPEERH